MFTDEELERYLEKRNLTETARKLIRCLRSTDPERRTKSTAANCSGRFPSLKMARAIQVESRHGELSTVWIWEYDDETYEFWDQVPQVKFSTIKSNGQPGGHLATVDFFVLQEAFTGWVEVERRRTVEEKVNEGDRNYYKDEAGRWHYRPGEEYAQQFGLGFQLVLVEEVNQTLAANNQFLADYRKPGQPEVPEEAQALIRSLVDFEKAIRLIDLVRHEQVKSDHVYRMIATGQLFVRLDVERLGEPERTLVYADQPSSVAHSCSAEVSFRGAPALEIRRAELSAGASLVWDGRVWTIINVGTQNYALQDPDKRVHQFTHDQLHKLVGSGVIVAPQASEMLRITQN